MNVFDKLQKIYETDLKEFKEEQKELTAARTPIKGTVSPSKRLHLEPGLSIKEWLVWLEKDTKPHKGYMEAKVIKRYRKLCEGSEPNRATQWMEEWEEVMGLMINSDLPEVYRGRWLQDLSEVIKPLSRSLSRRFDI